MADVPAMMLSTNPARARIVFGRRMTANTSASHRRILHAARIVFDCQMTDDPAPDVINDCCACFMELRSRKEMAMTAGGSVPLGNPNQP
jgi:hypothetical protein